MKQITIYNIKQQANLPSGNYGSTTWHTNPQINQLERFIMFNQNGTWVDQLTDQNGAYPTNHTWDSLAPSTTRPYEIRFQVTPSLPAGIYHGSTAAVRMSSTTTATLSSGVPYDSGFIPITSQTGIEMGAGGGGPPGTVTGPIQASCAVNFQIRDAASGPNGAEITLSGSFTLYFNYQISV